MLGLVFAIFNAGPAIIFWALMAIVGVIMIVRMTAAAVIYIYYLVTQGEATAREETTRRFL